MKKKYVEPEFGVIRYDEEDVIMASGCVVEGECDTHTECTTDDNCDDDSTG